MVGELFSIKKPEEIAEEISFRPHGWGAFFNPVPEMCDPVWLLHAICGGDDTT